MTQLLPQIPSPLLESSSLALEWPRLRALIAAKAISPLGRAWTLALEPSTDLTWIIAQQTRTSELRSFLTGGGSFDFHGLFDPEALLAKARIDGTALESLEILTLLNLTERVAAWRSLLAAAESARRLGPSIRALSEPLSYHDLAPLLRTLRGKIEPDGSLSDDASPELKRIRRAMESQHRAIEASLRRAARALREEGSTQSDRDDLITVRGERFVIPIKAEFKRKVPGVIHGSSSSGQTVYVEPLETIEQNNELVRLLDEEQSEIHRILVALTRALAAQAHVLSIGTIILAEVESHFIRARFAQDLDCTAPTFTPGLSLKSARHPLLELRMRAENLGAPGPDSRTWVGTTDTPERKPTKPIPLTLALTTEARQLIISGPNTGGKTVSLKTTGLLALMAQAGLLVPAEEATFPLFTAIFADIGDAQSIERNLSSFSAHVVNVDHISRHADGHSLVLLDELGSATDPEEGAALAVAVAEHFLNLNAWTAITTHLTSLKVYAAQHTGVLNAAVGFDQATLTPTYELRLGVPGASAGLNIAARLGMAPTIIASARAQMTTQQADIGAFLDQLHDQISAATSERVSLKRRTEEVATERARLETEGRAEQKQRTRELELKLKTLLEDFETQLKETVNEIEDKTVARKIQRDSALRMARVRREFSDQFSSTVLAHTAGADKNDIASPLARRALTPIKAGDYVTLKSLRRQATVVRVIDEHNFEVSMGQMKMRVPRTDIADVEVIKVVTPAEAARRRGNITVQTASGAPLGDSDYTPREINVIGRTAAEAEDEVSRYIDKAFLSGLERVRIVHGTGMGVLRRTLREFLKSHPHVATFAEASQQEGGQGATLVDLRQ
ncbi:endonuclease MutS2 [Granulicella tundricola]|uniref:Endonuclease MutS2 n=1 Tax=Granulicella tundricola (strain ATCC BAA-1859 / DSM 23138 / MP5ACTX9) TaxID=1198114 RepID=E8X444_GRATM|nr:Smr/MutS family protein [Granulicella tundricola]ADW67104.1 Smr protein/MutS2 [Granulicella tundricola MP5ACTX9]